MRRWSRPSRGVPAGELAGIGIGAPGPLNPNTGIMMEAPNLPGWIDVPLRTLVSEHFGRPTFLGNDANLAALAEYSYGAARGIRDMVYLTISTGIGSGVIADGRLLLGTQRAGRRGRARGHRSGRPALQLRQARPPGSLCSRPGHHPRRGLPPEGRKEKPHHEDGGRRPEPGGRAHHQRGGPGRR